MKRLQLPLLALVLSTFAANNLSVASIGESGSDLVSSQVAAPDTAPKMPSVEEDETIEPIHQLIRFLSYLTHGNDKHAYALVAPSSIAEGDPIAYRAALDWASFPDELLLSPNRTKFDRYHLGEIRWESPNRLRVFVHFDIGDKDEVMLVRESGKWFVAIASETRLTPAN